MEFSSLAYAKINLEFDREVFIQEYDTHILPHTRQLMNGEGSMQATKELNKIWNMVPETEYHTSDSWEQPGDVTTFKAIIKGRQMWDFAQILTLKTIEDDHPLIKRMAEKGSVGLRNETLGREYFIKEQFKDLKIVKWVYDSLPLTMINSIQCVSLPPNSFSTIHRDGKALISENFSGGVNKVYKSGFVVININITDGGVPLYWAPDHAPRHCEKANDPVYLTNDYLLHGVPICTSRRRQIRVTGIPTLELQNLIDKDKVFDLGKNYKFAELKDHYKY
jgi:hypothetical protein